MRVGFIGLGRMGLPMSQHVVRAGHELTVHNRTRTKESAVVDLGARAASTPLDVSRNADIVLACLPSLEATRQVFSRPQRHRYERAARDDPSGPLNHCPEPCSRDLH